MSTLYASNLIYQGVVALDSLIYLLEREGLSVMRSFDLRSANSSTGPQCFCTTHRPDTCDCQLVLFMVYDKDPEPATLVFQEQDGQTHLLLAESSRRSLSKRIETALRPAGINLSAQ